MKVEAIKEAIAALPDEERAALAAWLIEHEYDGWDQQMAKDFSAGGRGQRLLEKIKKQIDEGEFAPFKSR